MLVESDITKWNLVIKAGCGFNSGRAESLRTVAARESY